MIKIFQKLTVICLLTLIIFWSSPVLAATEAINRLQNTANAAGFETGQMSGQAAQWKLVDFLGAVIKMLLTFTGVLFMILIIYAGFLWMTARGNEEQIEKSKRILESSFTGLMIVVAAYAIVTVVSSLLTQMGFFV